MIRVDHVGLAARSLDHARRYLAPYGIRVHEEHGAGWAPLGPDQYLHVLPADPDGPYFRRQIAALLDADVRWTSWAVTASVQELRSRPVGATLGDGLPMTLGGVEYLTADAGLDEMMASAGALPYCTAYSTEGFTTRALVAATGGHPRELGGIAWLGLAGDLSGLGNWLGTDHDIEIRHEDGAPGLHTVALRTGGDDVALLDCGPLPTRR